MTKEEKEYDTISFQRGKQLFANAMVNLLADQGSERVREELRKILGPEAMKPFEKEFDRTRLEELVMALEPADEEEHFSPSS